MLILLGAYSSQVLGQESPLRNSFLKELYTCGVATVENDNVKVAIPFDVHGTDCGAPDCYTTEVRFAFPLRKEVVLPKSLAFEEEETGCVEPYRLTDVFQLQEQTPDYVIYYAPKHKRTLLIFKNRSMQSTNAFYCLGLAAGRIHRKNVYRVYEDYFLKENKEYQVYMLFCIG